jgi:F-type H+-transporting ATPase subunit delta
MFTFSMQAILDSTDVVQVNIPAESGDMGILANHVPSIEPLRPGVVEVIDSASASKKWFGERIEIGTAFFFFPFSSSFSKVSGGFATVHPNNKLTINAIEATTLDQISVEVTLFSFHTRIIFSYEYVSTLT